MKDCFVEYEVRWPHEAGLAREFADLLSVEGTSPFLRERIEGHFTGSAWLVSRDGDSVLLTHHRGLDRWLQPGGHADGDRDLAAVALREATEESGIEGLMLSSKEIFDIDKHWIPESPRAAGHWHYDVRYVVVAATRDFVVSDESFALAWRHIADIADDDACDDSMRRMALKWLAR